MFIQQVASAEILTLTQQVGFYKNSDVTPPQPVYPTPTQYTKSTKKPPHCTKFRIVQGLHKHTQDDIVKDAITSRFPHAHDFQHQRY
jgi:hypothetical protein